VLQCVAVCCNGLYLSFECQVCVALCVAVCCSVLHCVAVCCRVLQCLAVCCCELLINSINLDADTREVPPYISITHREYPLIYNCNTYCNTHLQHVLQHTPRPPPNIPIIHVRCVRGTREVPPAILINTPTIPPNIPIVHV